MVSVPYAGTFRPGSIPLSVLTEADGRRAGGARCGMTGPAVRRVPGAVRRASGGSTVRSTNRCSDEGRPALAVGPSTGRSLPRPVRIALGRTVAPLQAGVNAGRTAPPPLSRPAGRSARTSGCMLPSRPGLRGDARKADHTAMGHPWPLFEPASPHATLELRLPTDDDLLLAWPPSRGQGCTTFPAPLGGPMGRAPPSPPSSASSCSTGGRWWELGAGRLDARARWLAGGPPDRRPGPDGAGLRARAHRAHGRLAGLDHQARAGYGTEMRAAVLSLAFEELGALVGPEISGGTWTATRRLPGCPPSSGYLANGERLVAPTGTAITEHAVRVTATTWRRDLVPVAIEGLEQACRGLFGERDLPPPSRGLGDGLVTDVDITVATEPVGRSRTPPWSTLRRWPVGRRVGAVLLAILVVLSRWRSWAWSPAASWPGTPRLQGQGPAGRSRG